MMYKNAYLSGQYGQSFVACCECINREPSEDSHKLYLSTIIREVTIRKHSPTVKYALRCCLASSVVAHQLFAFAWQQEFQLAPSLKPLNSLLDVRDYEAFKASFDPDAAEDCFKDGFLLLGLQKLTFIGEEFERLVTHLRRFLLEHEGSNDVFLPFAAALAEHCFLREYALSESDSEKSAVSALKDKIESGSANPFDIAVYAAYHPLYQLKNTAGINDQALQELIAQQIEYPLKEEALKNEIEVISPIKAEVSAAVREMYEENPYPRWNTITIMPKQADDVRGNYLVAGCGTCKPTAQLALKFPNLDIQAIDLSLTSMAFGMRKIQGLDVGNVSFAQCDILDLDKLGKTFDAIDCSGVLHHMEDPVAGWKKLLGVLNPGGRMNIGLYSTMARRSITQAREYIKEKGFEPTPDGIRAFRQDIFNLPEDHPLKAVSMRIDFYNMSQCRDLVFHVQETTYTLPELERILDELGLVFEGFWLGKPRIEALFKQRFPEDPYMRNLQNWAKMEEEFPNLFAGMYQFICARKEEVDTVNPTWQGILDGKLFKLTGQR